MGGEAFGAGGTPSLRARAEAAGGPGSPVASAPPPRFAPPPGPGGEVVVHAAAGRRLADFIRLPWRLYAEDPAWVPPLLLERRLHLSRFHPYFRHARARLWVAYRGVHPVGRISAQVDALHLERHRDGAGFFGMLEAEDDPAVFAALFAAAERWLRDQGLSCARGPFNLSINEECGLLVEGFGIPPMILMAHGRAHYAPRVEALGYQRARDLLAYRLAADFTVPDVLRVVAARAPGGVRVRPLRRAQFRREIGVLRDIFEDAWSENWGFVPFTPAELQQLGRLLRWVVDERFVQIAEVDGIPAGMIVLLPNVNEAIRDLDGRLFPLGWLRLVRRLLARGPRTARVALMGVRKRYQRTPLGLALASLLIDAVSEAGRARGVEEVELSWILEDNAGVRHILEALGSILSKRYRIYEKELA